MNPRAVRRPAFIDRLGQRRHKPDYVLLLLTSVLLTLGLIVIYAISPGLSAQKGVGENYYVTKQLVAIVLGVATFIAVSHVPVLAWRRAQKPLIGAAITAALVVRLFGDPINGAYRWIQIGGFSFQAAELIKFALLIWLAAFLTDRIKEGTLGNAEKTLKPLLIALALIGIMVAKVQSDLGSTGVMVSMIAAMVFVAGMPLKRVAMIGGIIAVGTILAVSTSSYRRDRLFTYLHPERDCQNAGYQACQALIAVGSGGVFGLGLGRSVQAYGYLPEAANDSIFAIFAEKFGFFGVMVLLGLFVAFFARLLHISERAPDDFSRLLVIGVLAWLSTQALINVGAMIGLLPLKGITLPFISYGGTSMLFVTGAIGLVFQISRYTTYNANSGTQNQTPKERKMYDGRPYAPQSYARRG